MLSVTVVIFNLEKIGEGAFYECSSAEFAFPKEFESLKNIDFKAFYNCKKITSFPFSKALNKMTFDAFKGCSNLQILDFSKCTELWDINYRIIYEKGLDSLKKIILPPTDKKYDREHVVYLIVICTMKQIFTLEEIHKLFEMQ